MDIVDLKGTILKYISVGTPVPVAYLAAGATPAEIAELIADNDFAAAVAKSEALLEAALVNRVRSDETGSGARWLLERRWPDRYGPTAIKAAVAAKLEAAAQSEAKPATALERAEARRKAGQPILTVVGTSS